jgi:diacylglycerol kinase (ATP)
MTRRFCLVVNPAAGGGRSQRLLPAVTAALTAAGAEHEVHASSSLEHARELAVAAAGRGEVTVAFGGDGMVGALAAVTAGTGGAFGIIPAGRGNDFARTLGLPADATAAAQALARGAERRVDLIAAGSDTGQDEVLVAGSVYLGLPAIAAQTAAQSRFPPGELAYPVAGLRAVAGWRPAMFRLEFGDGAVEEFSGGAVVAANSRYFGAGMMVAPHADPADGLLDVVFIRSGSKLAMLRGLAKIKTGEHLAMPQVSTRQTDALTVTVDRDMPGGADGEILRSAAPLPARTPLRIRALPAALRLVG